MTGATDFTTPRIIPITGLKFSIDPIELPNYFEITTDRATPWIDSIGLNLQAVQAITWNNSGLPFKPDVLKRIESYEGYYGISSADMYQGYIHGALSVRIPYETLSDWINSYMIYK